MDFYDQTDKTQEVMFWVSAVQITFCHLYQFDMAQGQEVMFWVSTVPFNLLPLIPTCRMWYEPLNLDACRTYLNGIETPVQLKKNAWWQNRN